MVLTSLRSGRASEMAFQFFPSWALTALWRRRSSLSVHLRVVAFWRGVPELAGGLSTVWYSASPFVSRAIASAPVTGGRGWIGALLIIPSWGISRGHTKAGCALGARRGRRRRRAVEKERELPARAQLNEILVR